MLCVPKELNKTVLFLRVPDYDEVLKLEKIAKAVLGRNLSALEFMDNATYSLVLKHLSHLSSPFQSKPYDKKSFYVLIELSSNDSLDELFYSLLENIEMEISYEECALGDTETALRNIWSIREASAIGCER